MPLPSEVVSRPSSRNWQLTLLIGCPFSSTSAMRKSSWSFEAATNLWTFSVGTVAVFGAGFGTFTTSPGRRMFGFFRFAARSEFEEWSQRVRYEATCSSAAIRTMCSPALTGWLAIVLPSVDAQDGERAHHQIDADREHAQGSVRDPAAQAEPDGGRDQGLGHHGEGRPGPDHQRHLQLRSQDRGCDLADIGPLRKEAGPEPGQRAVPPVLPPGVARGLGGRLSPV